MKLRESSKPRRRCRPCGTPLRRSLGQTRGTEAGAAGGRDGKTPGTAQHPAHAHRRETTGAVHRLPLALPWAKALQGKKREEKEPQPTPRQICTTYRAVRRRRHRQLLANRSNLHDRRDLQGGETMPQPATTRQRRQPTTRRRPRQRGQGPWCQPHGREQGHNLQAGQSTRKCSARPRTIGRPLKPAPWQPYCTRRRSREPTGESHSLPLGRPACPTGR